MAGDIDIRDRVVRTVRVPASSLRPSPWNWRVHPERQRDALRGVLHEIGFAGAELVRELEDGSLELIDGHARAAEMGDRPVLVLVTDLTEDEARKLIAVHDPIGELAEMDKSLLGELLETVSADDADFQGMLDDMMKKVTEPDPAAGFTPKTDPEIAVTVVTESAVAAAADSTAVTLTEVKTLKEVTCPQCGNEFAIDAK